MIEESAYEISVFSHLIQIKRFKVLDLSRMPATGRARPNVRFGVIRDGRRARPCPSSDPRSSGIVFGGDILAGVVRHECRRDQGDHGA